MSSLKAYLDFRAELITECAELCISRGKRATELAMHEIDADRPDEAERYRRMKDAAFRLAEEIREIGNE